MTAVIETSFIRCPGRAKRLLCRLWPVFLAQAIFFLATLAFAQTESEPPQRLDERIEETIDEAARRIDVALAGKKLTQKQNVSKAVVKQHLSLREGGRFDNSTDFEIDLRLPNVEKKWQARFSSYDERESKRTLENRVRTRPRERRPGAGVAFLQELGRVKATFQPRLVLTDPLEMSYFLRFESSADDDQMKLHPKVELFADANRGTGVFASLEFEAALTDVLAFSANADQEYSDYENLYTTNQGLSLGYGLSDGETIGVGGLLYSVNQPAYHLVGYTLNVIYARVLSRDRLEMDVSPFLDFTRASGFTGVAGISLNLEVIF